MFLWKMRALGFPETLVSLLSCCSLLTSDFVLCNGSSDVNDFIEAITSECHYVNGTQQVRYLERYIYNQEVYVYFDSDVRYFVGKDDYGRINADIWNKDKNFIEQRRTAMEIFCRPNYELLTSMGISGRKVQPSIKISLMNQYEDSYSKQHMLICNVFGFYPSEIEVKWYRNGQEETELVQSTTPYHNGDWSFQILVMLETEIQKGDTFTCEVHHSSLKAPHRVDWYPQSSDAAKNKMAVGIVGFVLGIVFITVGLVIYMRERKGILAQ